MVHLTGKLNEKDALDRIEIQLLALGYSKQPNDWKEWTFLDDQLLEAKKRERDYQRGAFALSYSPDISGEYQTLGRLHLHFYENGEYHFTQRGLAEYQEISRALTRAGLPPVAHDELDVKYGREVSSPALFNETHKAPALAERARSALFSLIGLIPYALIVLWPGFIWMNAVTKVSAWSRLRRHLTFASACGLLFAPVPIPLSMFGPGLLVPLPLAVPLALDPSAPFISWLIGSVFVTTAVAGAVLALIMRAESRDRPGFEDPTTPQF